MISYFHQIISIMEKYLGPAAERFVRRGIEVHLGKNPEEITQEDVKKFAESVRVSLGFLTRNESTVEEAVRKIKSIID